MEDELSGDKNIQPPKNQITKLLVKASEGDKEAYDQLYPIVYDHLRHIARSQINREYYDNTLNKTDLVHELYVKLIEIENIDWQNRGHFYSIAAKAMRQILTDHARKKLTQKRGERPYKVDFSEEHVSLDAQSAGLVDIDEALKKLSVMNERLCKIVELRFYAGLSMDQVGDALGISRNTVHRDWLKARAWLYDHINKNN